MRDEVYMHLKPGRDTDHLFLLVMGEKLQLIERGSTEKPLPPQAAPLAGIGRVGKSGREASAGEVAG